MIARSVAICTNGTRVLGLGNIGPVASMPVMEGKAISTPECFEIERRLIEALPVPVMHDDVHGTAVVTVAAAITACRHAGIELRTATIGQLGLGAAGFGTALLMADGGVGRVIAFDPLPEARARAPRSMIRPGQVILALSNPDPEIDPDVARAAGAAFAADGRSVNNVLGYPGIFRGALQAGAPGINVEMKLAAALAIADLADEDELVPKALDRKVHDAVADAVREAAVRSGAARPEHATIGI